ncbi:hypothetical protein A0U91_07095 [Acetobacter persici]|uniref:Uncharacterized protein n=1 Tax=Acetobacter persici TaxID=1076596 RepID=A0A1U9LE84_9PROT|nr:hypothetical protein A0U91_07095 [Acetobacter persici]
MLRLIGSHYHFRRALPVVLHSLLGQTETFLFFQSESRFLGRQRLLPFMPAWFWSFIKAQNHAKTGLR